MFYNRLQTQTGEVVVLPTEPFILPDFLRTATGFATKIASVESVPLQSSISFIAPKVSQPGIIASAISTEAIKNITSQDNLTVRNLSLAPSYKPPTIATQIVPTPTIKPGSVVDSSSVKKQQVTPLDAIRREIVKHVNVDIANGNKVFFSPPNDLLITDIGILPTVPKPQTSLETTRRLNNIPQPIPDLPNTQFVSVSNILERFYPNFISPLLFNLAKTPTSLSLPAGCEITSDEFRCVPRGIYNRSPGISQWCEMNCRAGNCVLFMCECFCEDVRRSQNNSCHAIAEFMGVEAMDAWCIANCKVGYCPPSTCSQDDCLSLRPNGEA